MAPVPEETIWKGCSSAIRDFRLHLVIVLAAGAIGVMTAWNWRTPAMGFTIGALLVVPAGVWLWRRLERRSRVYEITTERVRLTQGILSRRTDELELYRVRDFTFSQSFLYRLFNKGDLKLTTSDATTPSLVLECLPADESLRNRLRQAVETCRDRKRARVAEMDWVDGADAGETPPA